MEFSPAGQRRQFEMRLGVEGPLDGVLFVVLIELRIGWSDAVIPKDVIRVEFFGQEYAPTFDSFSSDQSQVVVISCVNCQASST